MKKSTKILVPTLVLGVLAGAGALGVKSANANWFGFRGGENKDSLIQRLVEKFNLNQGEVETTFEEHRDQMQEERKAQQEERLSDLVSEGKLTEDQKNALIAKMEENQAEREQNREEFQNMTREERQAERQEHRDEMDQWFEEQGIDKNVLGGRGEMGGGHRGHGGRGMGNK